jgi:hypothetical protein
MLVALEPATAEGMASLREKYAEENRSDAFVHYGPTNFRLVHGASMCSMHTAGTVGTVHSMLQCGSFLFLGHAAVVLLVLLVP